LTGTSGSSAVWLHTQRSTQVSAARLPQATDNEFVQRAVAASEQLQQVLTGGTRAADVLESWRGLMGWRGPYYSLDSGLLLLPHFLQLCSWEQQFQALENVWLCMEEVMGRAITPDVLAWALVPPREFVAAGGRVPLPAELPMRETLESGPARPWHLMPSAEDTREHGVLQRAEQRVKSAIGWQQDVV
jgi:hypothetical protein